MAVVFQKTEAQERQFESFCTRLRELCQELEPYADVAGTQDVQNLYAAFPEKTREFFRTDRKFNLAVIGQVKAGKSSFLNTLLFGGQSVLPNAATPKTAALTRIEYSERNELAVEYYTTAEWAALKVLAQSDLNTPTVQAARETLSLSVDYATPLERCLSNGQETIAFDSYGELMERINEYVGENGTLTPAVKCVTVRLSLSELKNLSVVDTPGLNDPIQSRTEKTRAFIETCDAAFFLSRSSCFLDQNDLALLTGHLPQKGIHSLTLIASQFDSALMDTLTEYEDLHEAAQETKVCLRRHAAQSVDDAIVRMRRAGCPPTVLEIAERCRRPIFVSAMAESMAAKSPADYTPREQLIAKNLGIHGELSADEWHAIGNFEEVHAIFEALIGQKDETLRQKAASFVVIAKSDLQLLLQRMKKTIREDGENLAIRKKKNLAEQRTVADCANHVRDDVSAAFIQYLAPLNEQINTAVFGLRRLGEEWADPPCKTDMVLDTHCEVVSEAKLLLPWTWGRTKKVYSNIYSRSSFMDPEDARANLRQLQNDARQLLDAVFARFDDHTRLTNQLLAVASRHFESTSEICRAQTLKGAVQSALACIALPRRQTVETTDVGQLIPPTFSGLQRTSAEQQALRETAGTAADEIVATVRKQLDRSVTHLRDSVRAATDTYCAALCDTLTDRQHQLLRELDSFEQRIRHNQDLLEIISRYE